MTIKGLAGTLFAARLIRFFSSRTREKPQSESRAFSRGEILSLLHKIVEEEVGRPIKSEVSFVVVKGYEEDGAFSHPAPKFQRAEVRYSLK